MELTAGTTYVGPDGALLVCTSVDEHGVATVRMSPPPPAVLPPEKWAIGWYNADGVLIAAADDSPQSVTRF